MHQVPLPASGGSLFWAWLLNYASLKVMVKRVCEFVGSFTSRKHRGIICYFSQSFRFDLPRKWDRIVDIKRVCVVLGGVWRSRGCVAFIAERSSP